MRKLVCPACGERAVDRGALHALEGLIALENAGHLYSCNHCGLHFRRPYPSAVALIGTYSDMDPDVWKYHQRVDHQLAREALIKYCPKGNVLDVGCYCGAFLDTLPGVYSRYGIEPSPEAAQVARGRGVDIVAKTIEQLEHVGTCFDAITMLDVIEHLPQPVGALETLIDHLRPGGVLIITTGNTDALPWRLLRLDYWYYFTEHVSFFNRRWFDWFSQSGAVAVMAMRKFSHDEASFSMRMRQLLEALAYKLVHVAPPRSTYGRIVRCVYPLSRAVLWKEAPATRAWKDHMLIVMRKNQST